MKRVASALGVVAGVAAWSDCAAVSLEGAEGIPLYGQRSSLRPSAVGSVLAYGSAEGKDDNGGHVSSMRQHFGMESPALGASGNEARSAPKGGSIGIGVGYSWRALGSARPLFATLVQGKGALLDLSSSRLAFTPAPNLFFRVGRGSVSSLDQLELREEVRRSAISATYQGIFSDLHWQTTLAWGRSTGKLRGTSLGYLLESTLRFSDVHAVFGRMEDIGNNESAWLHKSTRRLSPKLDKLTVGYLYGARTHGPLQMDVGMLANRYLPAEAIANSISERTSYFLFIRLNLQ